MPPDVHSFHPLVYLGLLLLAGFAGGRVAKLVNLPRVSGYILAGMVLSPALLGVLPEEMVREDLSLVTEIALGIIAFSIGGALQLKMLRRLGKQILWITVTQTMAVFLLVSGIVFAAFFLLGGGPGSTGGLFALAVILGSISAATAPAPILAVAHEYRAKGPLTTILLGVVTLDDGVTILLFSIAGGVAKGIAGADVSPFGSMLGRPLLEIAISLLIGGAGGMMVRLIAPAITRAEALLGVALGAVFLVSGLSVTFHASGLLANMMLGFTVANAVRRPEQWFRAVEGIEEPVLSMFFVLAGAHLRLDFLAAAGSLALLLILGRSAGKILGTYAGARLSGATEAVRKYLPLGLLPQAGVSLGLVLAAKDLVPDPRVAEMMVNAVLGSVIVNELVSPALVRFSLTRAGETKRG